MPTTTLNPATSTDLNHQATTMQAIVQDQYGSSDVLKLQEIDKPQVGLDDALVRVHAAGLHIGDWHVMTGQPYLMRIIGFGFRAPKARVRGIDVAGVVEAVGPNVTQFQANAVADSTTGGANAYDGQFYKTRSPIERISSVHVPTFIVGGWYDLFQRGEPLLFQHLQAQGVPVKLLMGREMKPE